jgi:hypothetical protein
VWQGGLCLQQRSQGPQRALEQRLNADTSDHAGPELPCSCGKLASYHGRHGKTFESVLGHLHLERAYYYCAQCQSGFCPRDGHLRLEMFSLTPGVLRMTGSTAALDRSRVALPDFGVDATGDVGGCECQSFAIKIDVPLGPNSLKHRVQVIAQLDDRFEGHVLSPLGAQPLNHLRKPYSLRVTCGHV